VKRMSRSRAERQLVLWSAGTAARRVATSEHARTLAPGVAWEDFTNALRARKLLTTLGPRIVELTNGLDTRDFSAAVQDALSKARRQGAFLQLVALRTVEMLARAGIRSSALKGPLFGEAIYGDPGRRLSSDIDLLVVPEQLHDAVGVLRELGYEPPMDHVDSDGLPLLHFALGHGLSELPPVELHWRVHWYERSFARDRLLPPDGGIGSWRPEPAAELAALLLFYARDGFIDLRLASDISAWWDAYGADLPRDALGHLLRDYPPLTRPVCVGLAVAEQMVGLPTEQIMAEPPRLGRRERMAVRLANPNPDASRSQLYADMGLIDGLLSPRGGFGAFVRRQVFPPREVLDQHARHGARRRRRSSLGRGAGIVARYGLTMTHLTRAPETLR
jgi:Uncharacterised nucleotidyltransferase